MPVSWWSNLIKKWYFRESGEIVEAYVLSDPLKSAKLLIISLSRTLSFDHRCIFERGFQDGSCHFRLLKVFYKSKLYFPYLITPHNPPFSHSPPAPPAPPKKGKQAKLWSARVRTNAWWTLQGLLQKMKSHVLSTIGRTWYIFLALVI